MVIRSQAVVGMFRFVRSVVGDSAWVISVLPRMGPAGAVAGGLLPAWPGLTLVWGVGLTLA
eukprot:366273-Pleurochrysis_carterae.AAC.1